MAGIFDENWMKVKAVDEKNPEDVKAAEAVGKVLKMQNGSEIKYMEPYSFTTGGTSPTNTYEATLPWPPPPKKLELAEGESTGEPVEPTLYVRCRLCTKYITPNKIQLLKHLREVHGGEESPYGTLSELLPSKLLVDEWFKEAKAQSIDLGKAPTPDPEHVWGSRVQHAVYWGTTERCEDNGSNAIKSQGPHSGPLLRVELEKGDVDGKDNLTLCHAHVHRRVTNGWTLLKKELLSGLVPKEAGKYIPYNAPESLSPLQLSLQRKFNRTTPPDIKRFSTLLCKECGVHYGGHYIPSKPNLVFCPKEYQAWVAAGSPKEWSPGEPLVPLEPPRTQKARGLEALAWGGFEVPVRERVKIEKAEPTQLLGRFVRPCPVRPRHGFVESRTVGTMEEARELIEQTLAADPQAELLLMPFIEAPYSGVWTPGSLSIGRGHAGATSGKDAMRLPTLGDLTELRGGGTSIRERAGIKEAPYIEMLWRGLSGREKERAAYEHSSPEWGTLFVQLRDGPSLEGMSDDYVPERVEVRNVVRVQEGQDLLGWERLMQEQPEGTVVHHPGGSLASHYAIHAVLNKVPVLISREPRVGEVLEPQGEQDQELRIDLLREGFRVALEAPLSYLDASHVLLAGCHHIAAWKGKYCKLLGFSMGCAYRLTVTAALGEARHHGQGTKGRSEISRSQVYQDNWNETASPAGQAKFKQAMEWFLGSNNWPGGSYGGFKWYLFSLLGAKLWNALQRGKGKEALSVFNQLVHAAHNGGWAFNKFINPEEMSHSASLPVRSVIQVAPFLFEALGVESKVDWALVPLLDELGAAKKPLPPCPRCGGLGHGLERCAAPGCALCGKTGHTGGGDSPCPNVCSCLGGCKECMPPNEDSDQLWMQPKIMRAKFGPGNDYYHNLCRQCGFSYGNHSGARCCYRKDGTPYQWYKGPTLTGAALKQAQEGTKWWEGGLVGGVGEIVPEGTVPTVPTPKKTKKKQLWVDPGYKKMKKELEEVKLSAPPPPLVPKEKGEVLEAQAMIRGTNTLHVQYKTEWTLKYVPGGYGTKNVVLSPEQLKVWTEYCEGPLGEQVYSMAGSTTIYWKLFHSPSEGAWYFNGNKILNKEEM